MKKNHKTVELNGNIEWEKG